MVFWSYFFCLLVGVPISGMAFFPSLSIGTAFLLFTRSLHQRWLLFVCIHSASLFLSLGGRQNAPIPPDSVFRATSSCVSW